MLIFDPAIRLPSYASTRLWLQTVSGDDRIAEMIYSRCMSWVVVHWPLLFCSGADLRIGRGTCDAIDVCMYAWVLELLACSCRE